MQVEMKGYKEFRGHDGYGWEANLYINETKVGYVVDDGWGGGLQFEQYGSDEGLLFFKFKELVRTTTTWYSEFNREDKEGDWEIWLGDNLLKIASVKKHTSNQKIVLMDPNSDEVVTFKINTRFNKSTFKSVLQWLKENNRKYADWTAVNYMKISAVV